MSRKTFGYLFSIAAFMRVAFIWRPPLWYDENFTLILARLPFERMIQATAGDVHPPLWYIIEWTLFHALPSLPVWAIRLPALTFSLLAFVMFVRVCQTLRVPDNVQTFAAFLMAVLPMQIWYAQEGRMYTLLEFCVLAALYAGLNRKWFYFGLACLAMAYTQNYGLIYCIVIAVILVVLDWKTAEYVFSAGVLVVALYVPWMLTTLWQMTEISGRYWVMDASIGSVLDAIYKQFFYSAMLAPGIIGAYVVTFAALIIGVWAVMSEKITSWWIVITMAFAPVGVAWIASLLWQPLLIARPLIGVSPFLYLIVSWPLASLSYLPSFFDLRKLLYAACLFVPVLMFGISGYYLNIADMKGEKSPLISSLKYIAANWQDGDVLYYADDGPMVMLMPYTSLPQYEMIPCDAVLGSLSDDTRAALGISMKDLAQVPYGRAWVFASRSPLHPSCYADQIKDIAPKGKQVITIDDNQYIQSGVWLVEK